MGRNNFEKLPITKIKMKVKIKGLVSIPEIGKAMTFALDALRFNNETQEIRGATMYFNVYDKETGDVLQFVNSSDKVIEGVTWLTDEEKEKSKTKKIQVKN
jgi:hypothetical protein